MNNKLFAFVKIMLFQFKRFVLESLLVDVLQSNIVIRLIIVIVVFIIFYTIVAYRLIMIAKHDYVKPSVSQVKNVFRKEIVDRNGTILAINLPSASLYANPKQIIDPKECIAKLLTIIPDLNVNKLISDFHSNKTFVWIKRDLLPRDQEAISNLGMPGFLFEEEQKRIYTFGNLTSHVIGYVSRDLLGLAGLERSYDTFLNNNDITLDTFKKSLELSIDIRVQNILSEELDKALKEFNAIGGLGIIVNPNNGEILALVSKPDFNPHYPSLAKSEELFNMATLGTYETGSVFKALTIAIALESNCITLHDVYDTTQMKVLGFNIKDYHPRPGWHSISEIFLYSSNIGVSQIALEVGKYKLKEYFKKLGLLDTLKIEVPERGRPLFPSDKHWNDLTTATMSYGYGLSITPLHFVQSMVPVVNGGIFYNLTLIKNGNKGVEGTRIFSSTTSRIMSHLFRAVVKKGTGKRAELEGYFVGGKTGTVEKLSNIRNNGKRKYLKNSRFAGFLGLLPSFNPKYLIYVMLDDPKGTKETLGFSTGGWNAAPTVSKILSRIVSLYGIEPVNHQEE